MLRLANALRKELGVQPGDRVAVRSLNSAAFEELYHAGMLGAAVLNPLNLRFAPRELTHVLADSATKVVFVDVWFAGVIDSVREAAGVEKVVLMGEGDGPHDLRYQDLITAGEELVPAEPEEDDAALLMYTGGTTGLPKTSSARRCTRWWCGRPAAAVTEAELIDHCRGLIAGYKVPKSVSFRDEPLPLPGAMKVLKRELRAPYWEGRERAVN